MITEFARTWWALILRGIAGLLVGIIVFSRPGNTLLVLVTLFGAYALIDGTLAIIGAGRASQAGERWGPLFVEGIAGICAGMATFFWPTITAITLLLLIGLWAVARGLFELIGAVRLRKAIAGEFVMALGGAVSILFGVILIVEPIIGAIALTMTAGIYALVSGAMLIAIGLRLRYWMHHPGPAGHVAFDAR